MGSELDNELNVYKRIGSAPKDHPGRSAVRSLLDSFVVDGPKGRHRCLVHPPLWESILGIRHRNPVRRLPEPVVAFVLKRLFQALDLLHKECYVVHTDIKEANVLLGADESVLRAFEKEELEEPCPRKELDGGTIYLSRELNTPRDFGAPVLCDLGSAVPLDDGVEHGEDIQPDVYRAPEVILPVDVQRRHMERGLRGECRNCLNERALADTSLSTRRSGTPSRASTCSPAAIRNSRRTAAAPISLR